MQIYNGIFVEHIIQKVEEIEDQDTNFFFIRGGFLPLFWAVEFADYIETN